MTIDLNAYSTSKVTFEYIPAPSLTALSLLSIYYNLDDQPTVTVTATDLFSNLGEAFFVKIGANVVKGVSISTTEGSFVLPAGLQVGVYTLGISTDGINYITSTATFEVLECPAGTYCTYSTSTVCEFGYYCPQDESFEHIRCPVGYYQDELG